MGLKIGRSLKKIGKKINKAVSQGVKRVQPEDLLTGGATLMARESANAAGKAVEGVMGYLAPQPDIIDNTVITPTAPTADDETARAIAARELQRRYAGRGRAGTVLTGTSGLG